MPDGSATPAPTEIIHVNDRTIACDGGDGALGHPRVLRVPGPIVRFQRITQAGLDFELLVFVAQLEDRRGLCG